MIGENVDEHAFASSPLPLSLKFRPINKLSNGATKPGFLVTFTVMLMLIVASPTMTSRPLMKPTVGARTFSFHKPCLPLMKKKQCWSTMIGALLCFTPQEGDVLQGYSDDDNDSDHKNGDEDALASSPLPLSLNWNQPWVHLLLPQALMCRLRLDEETGYCCDSLMQLFWTAVLVLP
ncbi:hypothetical protein F2Q70_00016215 [Brassica cretica]|uniref:Prolamin-like domain-containing protein n=1 Tax=Brassica cretica TaxID=69181 RepID=A0A8S9KSB0_BRACR|nr:hypothetical protein F2Q70_00016215 [Brassica cretica]KAF2596186.1 hypothetical protein F2Q68_00009197 [Brassica cretica]